MRLILSLIIMLSITACSSQSPAPVRTQVITHNNITSAPALKGEIKLKGVEQYKINEALQCVPYTRGISGVNIFGNAHTWWGHAKGKYERGKLPKIGAVIVLSKTKRNKYGHIATVTGITDSRTITVAHSNWGSDRATRRIIYERMPVKDVSNKNDWSKVKFFNYPSQTFGREYPVTGFIYP